MKRTIFYAALLALFCSCGKSDDFDATGTFEATEVVVSAESAGRIVDFSIDEGDSVVSGEVLGAIDSVQLVLQRRQLLAQLSALLNSRPDIGKQVTALREQITKQKTEQARVSRLLASAAATTKQLDDVEAQIKVLEGELSAMLSTLGRNTATINSNAVAIEAQIAQLDDRIEKCRVSSPISGVVLAKYMEAGEFAVAGKPLLKVASLDELYLRAYFTSDQLPDIKLGDKVTVTADFGGDKQVDYDGCVNWIASESEFTPKTIQTKDSRANLVYAVKIAVKNDGRLKIGFYGRVRLER